MREREKAGRTRELIRGYDRNYAAILLMRGEGGLSFQVVPRILPQRILVLSVQDLAHPKKELVEARRSPPRECKGKVRMERVSTPLLISVTMALPSAPRSNEGCWYTRAASQPRESRRGAEHHHHNMQHSRQDSQPPPHHAILHWRRLDRRGGELICTFWRRFRVRK